VPGVRLRIAVAALVAVILAVLVNAYVVTSATRAAEPFAGGRVLELDGPDLNVREYGPSGERAIVLLHGYSASIQWWEPVAARLARNQRVIAIDLVGHGGSEAPGEPRHFGAVGQADAVHNALTALGVRHAIVVGHSMGGSVASELAARHPEVVERVVVSDTPADGDLVSMPLLGKMVCWPVLGPALDHFRSLPLITRSSLQTGFARDYAVPPFAYRSLERLTYAGVCDSKAGPLASVANTLAGLDVPVLVVWGETDVLTPTAPNVTRYGAAGMSPRIIAGAGHSPMVEKPDEFLSAIADFVTFRS
jgi:pimeloyl-ACP methyl ester carboxylesterase